MNAYLFFPTELEMLKKDEDLLNKFHKEIPSLMKKVRMCVSLPLPTIYSKMCTLLSLKAVPSCSDILLKCQWQGERRKCGDLFSLLKTDSGYCCSFNAVRQSDSL